MQRIVSTSYLDIIVKIATEIWVDIQTAVWIGKAKACRWGKDP